ncbi:NAD(P)/FAD-dependent oxidoreductase [Yinghuangia seranimata]|uniref:NAD(P)/FAD-dependent oxidoreductase n=1 Tax=Yinghuangia seranimata TaxID=408067 RepID=UPI00248AE420|nr:NAD(P)/FAD-dependent oxidoreductase [Yinghuangia seranimata]MDI2132049.1 NAD(P)/FAD-dependent oxidoreductase [Yinghuangia seranimata]
MTTTDAYDLLVIGAGPAGFAAATTAADAGLTVALIDAGHSAGGQFYRQPAPALNASRPKALHHGWRTYEGWMRRLAAHVASGSVRHLTNHQVWAVERVPDAEPGGSDGGFAASGDRATLFVAHALVGVEAARSVAVRGRALLLATGAYERQLPFPGWTLPGVVTAGGAQAQLKDSLVVPGQRVVVAGTGPLLLSVAASLVQAGAAVPAVVEAADPLRYARHLPALLRNPGKLVEGAGYAGTLLRYGVPVRTRHVVVAALGTRRVEAVTVAKVDRSGRVVGPERTVACDTLAVGYGLDAQLDLALELGCPAGREPDGGWALEVDDGQWTGVEGVWAAGETTGVGGAQLALAEGELAAWSVVARLRPGLPRNVPARPVRQRARLRAFASALQGVHQVPRFAEQLRDDTDVCRCEEVPYAGIRDAVTDLGATDPRSVKLLTRAGMGWCQGRMCGTAVQCIVSELTAGRAKAVPPSRPLACPVPLGVLAEQAGDPPG